jgi:hypothetical protein
MYVNAPFETFSLAPGQVPVRPPSWLVNSGTLERQCTAVAAAAEGQQSYENVECDSQSSRDGEQT